MSKKKLHFPTAVAAENKSQQPHAFVLLGDMHVNHAFGLMPPRVTLDTGIEVHANRYQLWLWNNYIDFCKRLDRYAVDGILLNGDLPHGINPTRDVEVVSINEADQIRFAEQVLQPLLYKFEVVNGEMIFGAPRTALVYSVRGTGFHSGRGGAREELIAQRIGAVADEDGIRSKFEWWIDWRGKLIHATHHTSTASVYPLTPLVRQHNAARVRAQGGWLMPDVVVRSHIHKTHKYEANDGRIILTTPAWQLATEFSHKVAPGDLPDIGGLILWLDDEDQVQVKRVLYPLQNPKIHHATG